jgi:hypothetical protein
LSRKGERRVVEAPGPKGQPEFFRQEIQVHRDGRVSGRLREVYRFAVRFVPFLRQNEAPALKDFLREVATTRKGRAERSAWYRRRWKKSKVETEARRRREVSSRLWSSALPVAA